MREEVVRKVQLGHGKFELMMGSPDGPAELERWGQVPARSHDLCLGDSQEKREDVKAKNASCEGRSSVLEPQL